ncbi:MAG: IS21 family transposase, partial [Thermoanaerobaculaceae bacterium]|nr:IS21 family transposase [Thermoanaerobaculaceae bacterium]
MNDEKDEKTFPNQSLPDPETTSGSEPTEPPLPSSRTLAPEESQGIIELYQKYGSLRTVASKTGRDRKTVRSVLELAGVPIGGAPTRFTNEASKLDPFRQAIREKHEKRLTTTRILREISEQGYTGGRTILADYVRSLPRVTAKARGVKRRFETAPGEEMQVDWSLYTVLIGGVLRQVHALLCVLAHSRYLHVRFYRDERQPTLLEGLARAFEAFGGTALRVVFDNMATVVLARIGSKRTPLWHPRLLDFARHYGFEPFACRVRHPDRKGKDERLFDFLENDFVRGSSFASRDDLNQRGELWAATVANT